jgi:hypothetical protein
VLGLQAKGRQPLAALAAAQEHRVLTFTRLEAAVSLILLVALEHLMV